MTARIVERSALAIERRVSICGSVGSTFRIRSRTAFFVWTKTAATHSRQSLRIVAFPAPCAFSRPKRTFVRAINGATRIRPTYASETTVAAINFVTLCRRRLALRRRAFNARATTPIRSFKSPAKMCRRNVCRLWPRDKCAKARTRFNASPMANVSSLNKANQIASIITESYGAGKFNIYCIEA